MLVILVGAPEKVIESVRAGYHEFKIVPIFLPKLFDSLNPAVERAGQFLPQKFMIFSRFKGIDIDLITHLLQGGSGGERVDSFGQI